MPEPAHPEENLEDRFDWRFARQLSRFEQQQLQPERAFQLSGISPSPAVRRLFLEQKSMKIQNPEAKEKLIQRLRRVEGQVRGVQGMLDEERDCREIMQQLAAIHSAVQGASRIFLQEYATACLIEMDVDMPAEGMDPRKKREQIVQDMIALLDKAP